MINLRWGIIIIHFNIGIRCLCSATLVHLSWWAFGRAHVWLLSKALDAAALRPMGVLQLDLVLCARSTLVELLIRITLVLLVEGLNSASGFGATQKTFLVERVVQVLNERSTSRIHRFRWSWVRSSYSITSLSLSRSVSSAACSSLASTIPVLLCLIQIHNCICWYGLIKHAIFMICILWNDWRLWNICILIFYNISLIFRRFDTEARAQYFWGALYIVRVVMDWVFIRWDLLD